MDSRDEEVFAGRIIRWAQDAMVFLHEGSFPEIQDHRSALTKIIQDIAASGPLKEAVEEVHAPGTNPLNKDGSWNEEVTEAVPGYEGFQDGDYVLATKWEDGSVSDHWAVGFVQGMTHHGRYFVVDSNGVVFRHNGFRRVEHITDDEGLHILKTCPQLEGQDKSVWDILRKFREQSVDRVSK